MRQTIINIKDESLLDSEDLSASNETASPDATREEDRFFAQDR